MHGNGPYNIYAFSHKNQQENKTVLTALIIILYALFVLMFVLWQYISNAVKKIHTTVIILHIQQVFDVHVTVHRVRFLIIKPVRCTNFSNYFLETLHVSDISSVHHQELFAVHTAIVYYVIQVC